MIKSVKIASIPGDNLRAFVAPMVSLCGAHFGAGTEFRPISAGHDNSTGIDLNEVRIGRCVFKFAA